MSSTCCRRSFSAVLSRSSRVLCNNQSNSLRWTATAGSQIRNFSSVQQPNLQGDTSGLPDSIKRVGVTSKFPNEYPGQVYSFNWCLNGDGVTPLKKSAFRICKPLDLKVAGLAVPSSMPLKVSPGGPIPEAGSDDSVLSFEQFDESSQTVRDYLSLSDHLYCPEGHVPGTRTGVRIITNDDSLAPDLLAYLERAPRKDPAESLPITVYVLSGSQNVPTFAGYAIEEVEVPMETPDNDDDWHDGTGYQYIQYEAKSVASVVVADAGTPRLDAIVAGIESCQKALAEDEESRQAEKEAASKEQS